MAGLDLKSGLKAHGNRLTSGGLHDVYVVREARFGHILHFGETSRGWEVRGWEWQKYFADRYGLPTVVEPLWVDIAGKASAKLIETRYIRTYEKVFGHKPGFYDAKGNFIQTQLTEH